jgi:spoIIIJ-associated protein
MEESSGIGAPPPPEAPEKVARAKEFTEGLLRRLGGRVEIEVRETREAIGVSLRPLEGNVLELGSALVEAMQYLVNRVVNPRPEGRKWVNLDVGGFREEGDPAMAAMANRLAASAVRMGKVLAVAPMSARDRRMIHLALVDAESVSTRSEGEGIFRQLLIVPGKKAGGGQGVAPRSGGDGGGRE